MDILRYIQLGPALLVTAVVVLGAAAVGAGALRRSGPASALTAAATVLLVGSLIVIGLVTLAAPWPGGAPYTSRTANLVPLAGLRQQWGNVNGALAVANVLGNVLLFMPLGALARLVWRRAAGLALTGLGLSLSAAIELLQYLLGRAADIDDVLLNTLGCAMGTAVATVLLMALRQVPGQPPAQGKLTADQRSKLRRGAGGSRTERS